MRTVSTETEMGSVSDRNGSEMLCVVNGRLRSMSFT
jgi:hypothetical protein